MKQHIKIQNRKSKFNYTLEKEYIAGLSLTGSEVKSLSSGLANITEAYVYIKDGEAYLKNSYIKKYMEASYTNHEERQDRKLLLNKSEIKKIHDMVKQDGMTAYPMEIFKLNNKFKLKVGIGKGKKDYDKRETIKERDVKRINNRENI